MAVAVVGLAACGGKDTGGGSSAGTCADANLVGGVCAGVPSQPLCGSGACTDGGACKSVIAVASSAEVAKIAGAKAGDCVTLAAGDYAAIALGEGVSLFGASAATVHVKGVTLKGGTSRVAGIGVSAPGIVVSAGSASIDAVRVDLGGAAKGVAVKIGAGATASLRRAEITGADGYGVDARGATGVTLDRTLVTGGRGPALWVGCTKGPCCAGPPSQVAVSDSKFEDTGLVGAALYGTKAVIHNLVIAKTKAGIDLTYGAGMAVGCSTITVDAVTVRDNADYGILIQDSTGTVNGLHAESNLGGLWLQSIGKSQPGATVTLSAAELVNNRGIGFGVTGASKGVTAKSLAIDGTTTEVVPAFANGTPTSDKVGDGVNWSGAAQLVVVGLSVSRSGRASVLIDGGVGAGSGLTDVTLAQGDDGKGIIQQHVDGAGQAPVLTNAPKISTFAAEKFSIAAAPPDIAPPDI